MNNASLIELFNNPEQISSKDSELLNNVLLDYPYFQGARAIQLKALHESKSYKYNQALKRTAAHTIDRQVLFEYITSQIFIESDVISETVLEDIEVIDVETIQELHKKITDNIQATEDQHQKDASLDQLESKVSEMLEIGKPIVFNKSEPHSFNEWMQLISKKPLDKEVTEGKTNSNDPEFIEKNELIDRFIKSNPKIGNLDKSIKITDISHTSSEENESLMTETLAKVYLEQRKFENAIKAYRILSLKYPEKSGFFADRIKAIKILQKNKS